MRRSSAPFILFGGLLIVAGCGSGSSAPPDVVTHFAVTSPTPEVAGTPFSVTVTAVDASNRTIVSYSGMVHFASSDPQAVLPANSPLMNGTGTFSVTLKTASSETITVNDATSPAISGASNPITVTGPPVTHLSVTAPANEPAGASFSFTVTALDASNNVATGYTGSVHFSSTDAQAALPANSPLTNGTATFSAILKTMTNQTITATDAATASITGTSGTIVVGKPSPLAIASTAPPNGSFGVNYGPSTTEYFRCVYNPSTGWNCILCNQVNCSSLPPCARQHSPLVPCLKVEQEYFGFPLSASGGIPAYTWNWVAATNSSLPPGLTLRNGNIAGKPTSAGTYNLIVTVTDSESPANQVSAPYQIVIALPPPPVINATPLPAIATLNSPYVGFNFTATSPATPLTWSESGALPLGMTLSAAGALSGTPTQSGSFPIVVNVQDTQGQNAAPQNFTIEVLAKGFLPTGSMALARVLHTATLLNAGAVLVTGGVADTSTFPTQAELYDPVKGSFTQATGSMTTIRVSPTATLLKSGKVLLVGGKGSAGNELASAELYDPTAQTFAATTGSMSSTRSYHTATLLSDGTVLVAGGLDVAGDAGGNPVASAEIYDPSTNSFTATGPMTTGRFFHTATLLGNGKVLITGGLNSGVSLATAELYDPTTKTFSPAGSMSVVRMGHTATLLASGKVLLAGGGASFGGNTTTSAEVYDQSNGSFTLTNPMVNARSLHTATLLSNGQVLVAGGASVFYGHGQSYSLSAAELFDPTTGNFTATADMTALRESHTATLLQSGYVLVVGGADGTIGYSTTTTVLATAELYQ